MAIGNESLPTRKSLAMIKNMIEPAIVGSIPEYNTVTEYLDRIKSQFTGSSKTYKESVHWLFKDICHLADEAAGDRVLL